MATLTPEQIALIRAKSGDLACSTGDPVVDDVTLQRYYDANDGSIDCTIVSVLEDRLALVKSGASVVTDFGTRVDNSERDSIRKLLDYWQTKCGGGGARLTTGVLGLNIDATCDDVSTWGLG